MVIFTHNLKAMLPKEILPTPLLIRFHRPLLGANAGELGAIQKNALFLAESVAGQENEVAAEILKLASSKMLADVELEIAARN